LIDATPLGDKLNILNKINFVRFSGLCSFYASYNEYKYTITCIQIMTNRLYTIKALWLPNTIVRSWLQNAVFPGKWWIVKIDGTILLI